MKLSNELRNRTKRALEETIELLNKEEKYLDHLKDNEMITFYKSHIVELKMRLEV